MPVAIGEYFQVRFFCFMNQQLGINVRHFRVTDIFVADAQQAEQSNLASGLASAFDDLYAALLSEHAQFVGVSVQLQQLPADGPVIWSPSIGQAGEVVGMAAPSQLAGLIQLRADLPGRRANLRSYIPFPGVADIDTTGLPTGSYIARLETLGEALVGPITTPSTVDNAGFELQGTAWPLLEGDDGDLVYSRARPGFATQRRRGYYGKMNLTPFA